MSTRQSTKPQGFTSHQPHTLENRLGLGWLRFSCNLNHLSYWISQIKHLFRCELYPRGKGWNGYSDSLTGNFSILIAYTPIIDAEQKRREAIASSPNEGMMTVDIPQSAIESLNYRAFLELWRAIYSIDGLKFTRVDVNFDDYQKVISPEALHNRCKLGGVGVPRYENMRGWDEFDLKNGVSAGYTLYFGSNKSEKQIRFYDKSQESKGKLDCYRWEVELKGEYAQKFGESMIDALGAAIDEKTLTHTIERISKFFRQIIRGSIDFREIPLATATKNLPRNWAARMPVCDFWAELMDRIEPAKLVLDKIEPTLQSTVNWLIHQVTPALALIKSCYGYWGMPFNVWLNDALDKGKERWKQKHEKLFRESTIISPAYTAY